MKTPSISWYALSCLAILSACTAKSNDKQVITAPKKVPVSNLIVMDTTIYKDYIADIQSVKNIELRSRLSGFLEHIYVDEGASVKKGQVLFRLSDDMYKADYARAKANFNTALTDVKKVLLELERTKDLAAKNIVSKTEVELLKLQYTAAESKVEEARSMMQQAKTQLDYTLVRAPFDGKIDRIPLKEGSLLEQGSLLTTVSSMKEVNVYFDISENEYLSIVSDSSFNKDSFNKDVKLILSDGNTYPHCGKAAIVESEFEKNTGSISLRAKFVNPQGILKHGASGKISVPIQTGDTKFVHQKSVFEIQDKTYVYILNNDKTVSMKSFQAGQRVGHYYIVNAGLSDTDQIVFEGVQSLKDGMKVEVIPVKL